MDKQPTHSVTVTLQKFVLTQDYFQKMTREIAILLITSQRILRPKFTKPFFSSHEYVMFLFLSFKSHYSHLFAKRRELNCRCCSSTLELCLKKVYMRHEATLAEIAKKHFAEWRVQLQVGERHCHKQGRLKESFLLILFTRHIPAVPLV